MVTEGSEQAEILRLDPTGRSPALPFVARAGAEIGARWDQYFRRRADFSVAFAFRDRVWEATAGFALGGRTFRAAEMFAPVCAGIREGINAAVPDVAAVGLSVPDRWPVAGVWALPHALATDGWNPALLARESVAVLADWLHGSPRRCAKNVLLVSLGAGSTWASLVVRGDTGAWQFQDTVCDEVLSGRALRELLIAEFSRELVARVRKDPTESAADDENLHDAVEQVLDGLQTQRQCDLRAVLFGNPVTVPFSAARLTELARPLVDRLQKTITEWQGRFSAQGPIDAVLCWGDLASRLPIHDRLSQAFSSAETHALDPHCVARGVARLVALVRSGRLSAASADRRESVPWFQNLPTCDAFSANPAQAQASVIRLDGNERPSFPIVDALRFGRDPNADCVIEKQASQVSNAHAVIVRKGSLYVLSDLQSINGTYVNGRLLTGPTPLNHGDTITLAVDGPRFRFQNQ